MIITDSQNFSLSIVIPVYNESGNVQALTEEIIQALPAEHYQYEIIFVDDGSKDETPQHLETLRTLYPQVSIVTHIKNYGQSAALISGAKAAKNPWMVTLDGDGQNDPADIVLLCKALKEAKTFSVVLGNRKKRQDTWLKRASSRIANRFRQKLLKDGCPDTGCSLKLFPRETFLELPRFNHMHRYFPALFKRYHFDIINVPVNHRPRVHGVSKYGFNNRLWVGITDIIGVMWLMRRPCYPQSRENKEAPNE
jgi:dolichol-phosphate mannosyltransferase